MRVGSQPSKDFFDRPALAAFLEDLKIAAVVWLRRYTRLTGDFRGMKCRLSKEYGNFW